MEKALLLALSLSGLSFVSTDTVRKYHYVDTAYSWLDAKAHCRKEFVDLAAVENQEDNDRLLGVLQGRGSYVWIGLQDDLTKWTWTTNNKSFNSHKDYSNWETEKLDNSDSRDKCIVMKTSGTWLDQPCEEERPSVCYDEEGPDAYVLVNKPMGWTDARKFCQDLNATLVNVRNSSENERVVSLLPADAWIGLSRWSWKKWSDGSRVAFRNWGEGQPDTKEGVVASCGAVDTATAAWWDDDCNTMRPFVCYSILKTKKVRVRLKFRSEADLNDPAVNQQILEQLRVKLAKDISEFQIRWMEKDGQMFHKKNGDRGGRVEDPNQC